MSVRGPDEDVMMGASSVLGLFWECSGGVAEAVWECCRGCVLLQFYSASREGYLQYLRYRQ